MVKNISLIFMISFLTLFLFINYNYIIQNSEISGDEGHYLELKNNIQHGYFSKTDNPDLWHPPGYPIFLSIISIISDNINFLRLTNLILLIISFLINAKSICEISGKGYKTCLTYSFLLLPWYVDAVDFFRLHTESFSYFLISIIIYLTITNKNSNLKFILIGILSITKFLFSYVIIVVLALNWLIRKDFKFNYLIMILPIIVWFSYTYNLTNKFFYSGSSGGMQLYCMTCTNENNGEWQSTDDLLKFQDSQKIKTIINNHPNQIEFDSFMKKLSVTNIKNEPKIYLKNVLLNVGNLFHYRMSRDSFLSIIFSFKHYLILFLFFTIPISNYKNHLIIVSLIFVYLAMSLLLSSYLRFYLICTPLVVLNIYKLPTLFNNFRR